MKQIQVILSGGIPVVLHGTSWFHKSDGELVIFHSGETIGLFRDWEAVWYVEEDK